jgi:tetratricopeptide (TPR) repeat protein
MNPSPATAVWRAEVERIRAAVLASDDAAATAALDVLMPTLSDARGDELLGLAECHALRGSLQLRFGQHLEALHSFGAAAVRYERAGEVHPHVFALTQLATALSSLGLHAEGVQAASTATQLGIAHGLHRDAAQALMVVGLCAMLMGDPFVGERYVVEALGIALAENDQRVLTWGTINVIYVITALADQCLAEGRADLAEQALRRGVRHVHRGDRWSFADGTFNQALWWSNKAGWLARRGELDEAQALYAVVVEQARERRWIEIERHAAYGLGLVADRLGDGEGLVRWLVRCIEVGSEHDAYRVVERAHDRLALWHETAGQAGEAARHRVSATLLRRQAEARRGLALDALRLLDEHLLLALSRADQTRLDAELERLHRERTPEPDGSVTLS